MSDKYKDNKSSTIAKIIKAKCPNIYAMLVMLEKEVNAHEKIEITYWTETNLHIWVDDSRFKEHGSITAMRMGFSVDFENDVVFFFNPYCKQDKMFFSRSHKWNRILKQKDIPFNKYIVKSLKQVE
jgi:hypothetical protein